MTVQGAIDMTQKTLAAVGKLDWSVEVIECFPDNPKRCGFCSPKNRRISLSAVYLHDDLEMIATACHEVAHCICVGDQSNRDHDLAFQAAEDFVVQKVDEMLDEELRRSKPKNVESNQNTNQCTHIQIT
jgi:hypothetical protein